MLPSQALRILNALADGVDPHTGEELPSMSPYQQPDTIRALNTAIKAVERLAEKVKGAGSLPENAGRPWTKMEDDELCREFETGEKLKALSTRHKRTPGAIQSRLIKMGKITL
jgi:hypothetical protein